MRSRLLSLTLGAALAVAATPLLAGAVAAEPPPAPVEISAPVSEYVRDTTPSFVGFYVLGGGISAQTFVAPRSAAVTAVSQPAYVNSVTLKVYAEDQFTDTTGTSLTPVPDSVFSGGTPLGTAVIAPGSGGYFDTTLHTSSFDQTIDLVEGETYWLVMQTPLGEPVRAKTNLSSSEVISAGGGTYGYEFALRLHATGDNPVGVDLTGTEGDNGWFTGPVTSTYTCWSGVEECPGTTTISDEGEHQPSGAVYHNGDPFAWFHHVRIDTTNPTITGSAARTGTGFTVTWTCSDATSDIAECPEPTQVTGKGDDTYATATAVDKAGNTATASVHHLYSEKIAPKLTITGVVANKTYKHGTKLTPACVASTGINYGVRKALAAEVTCTGTTTKHVNKDGSVKYRYLATATDTHPRGGTTTRSVSWTVAAKPKPTVVVNGLPSKKKNGHPVILASKSYDVSFVFRDANGKLLKGKPTWLHSVQSNKSGSKGTPWKKVNGFSKKKGAWTKAFVPGHHYKGEYRKYGVIAPDGTRYHFVVYVK